VMESILNFCFLKIYWIGRYRNFVARFVEVQPPQPLLILGGGRGVVDANGQRSGGNAQCYIFLGIQTSVWTPSRSLHHEPF
jgi:hypothetical protein